MIVISDTSPVTNLITIGWVSLLQELYGEVIIPVAVFKELSRPHADLPEWLHVQSVKDHEAVVALLPELDYGEAEAITLASELSADLLLMDEHRGRAVATRSGLNIIGLLGVLVEAKQRGKLLALRPALDELEQKAGFWVGTKLRQQDTPAETFVLGFQLFVTRLVESVFLVAHNESSRYRFHARKL